MSPFVSRYSTDHTAVHRAIINGLGRLERFPDKRIHVLPRRPESSLPFGTREMVFLLMPEACEPSVNRAEILNMVFDGLRTHGYDWRSISLVPGAYLADKGTMKRHYGVAGALFERGTAVISDQARARFLELIGAPVEKSRVLGGAQVMREFSLSGPQLDSLWIDPSQPRYVKLAPGTYMATRTINGEHVHILSGHFYGLEQRFTGPGKQVVAMEISDLGAEASSWQAMRTLFIGATNPKQAVPNSLRRNFFDQRESLGIRAITVAENGAHLSASPLEGAGEAMSWFDAPLFGTAFGRRLLECGLTPTEIRWLLKNPIVEDSSTTTPVPFFDLVEEKDPAETAVIAEWVVHTRRRALPRNTYRRQIYSLADRCVREGLHVGEFWRLDERTQTDVLGAMFWRHKDHAVTNFIEKLAQHCEVNFSSASTVTLASTSPRRKAILTALGITFESREAASKEFRPQFFGRDITIITKTVALMKLLALMKANKPFNKITLVADTLVHLADGTILGKPQGDSHEEQIANARHTLLNVLPGQKQIVSSSLIVYDAENNKLLLGEERTAIKFKPLTPEISAAIEDYLVAPPPSGPIGKSGSYGVQDLPVLRWTESIEGDVNAVVGLGVRITNQLLAEAGIGARLDDASSRKLIEGFYQIYWGDAAEEARAKITIK